MVICNDGGERTEIKREKINDYRFYIKLASAETHVVPMLNVYSYAYHLTNFFTLIPKVCKKARKKHTHKS
jgi:hypothetical protein